MNELRGSVHTVFNFPTTRGKAVADGLLINLDGWATELGFRMPVACTAEVWRQVKIQSKPEDVAAADRRRICFLLKVLRSRIKGLPQEADRLLFSVRFSEKVKSRPLFIAVCGPGDRFEPVLTILTLAEARGGFDGT